jgi:hypothetical protein
MKKNIHKQRKKLNQAQPPAGKCAFLIIGRFGDDKKPLSGRT